MSYCNQTPFPLCKGGVWAWDYCWPCWMWTKKLCMRINLSKGWTGSLTTKLYSCAQPFWFTFCKINHPDNYEDLQRDIDTIQECICKCHLTLNPSKCKYLIASRRRQPHLPRTRLFIGRDVLELVDSYCYLGVLVTSKLSWADHINHICSKARKLVVFIICPIRYLFVK